MKEIPLHQEMVSVTGSVTWISHGSSVIGISLDPRRQRDERHDSATGRKEPPEAMRPTARRRKTNATPLPCTAVKGRIPRFTDRCGKRTDRIGNRSVLGGASRRNCSLRTDSQPSWTIFGLKKKVVAAFPNWRSRILSKVFITSAPSVAK